MEKNINILARAINTANQWSSDRAGHGLALLQLGSTRKIHSEVHREAILAEIDQAIQWNYFYFTIEKHQADDVNNPAIDVPLLRELHCLVDTLPLFHEWLTFDELKYRHELIQDI